MKNNVLFLDRDGVINIDNHYISSINEIIFYKDIKIFLKRIKKYFSKIIIITNQSAVARGIITLKKAKEINEYILYNLNNEQNLVDDYFMCPHHPEGKIIKYSVNCDCRKPKIGLFIKAKKKYQLDFKNSFFIGDKLSDYKAAINAGLCPILINRDENENNKSFKDFDKIKHFIVERFKKWKRKE